MSPVIFGFVAMCAAFGGVAAWAVLLRKPPEIVVVEKTVAVPGRAAEGGPAPPPPPSLSPEDVSNPEIRGTAAVRSGSGGLSARTTSKTAEPTDTAAPIDTSGFKLSGPSGPVADSKGSGAGGQRSQGELEGVVNRNKPGTRRCWDRAVEAAPASAPRSVKINVSFTVTASGSVTGVSASGGDAYPGLASCLVSRISAWQFPPSSGSDSVNVPFGFNRQ